MSELAWKWETSENCSLRKSPFMSFTSRNCTRFLQKKSSKLFMFLAGRREKQPSWKTSRVFSITEEKLSNRKDYQSLIWCEVREIPHLQPPLVFLYHLREQKEIIARGYRLLERLNHRAIEHFLSSLLVGDLSTSPSVIDHSHRQKISKDTVELNSVISQLDLILTFIQYFI